MTGETLMEAFLLVFLLAASSFFSASETAMLSLSKLRLRYLVDEKVKNAKKLSSILEQPNKLLSTILVGNNIANIAASSLATSLAIRYFSRNGQNAGIGVGVATAIMTIFILIFGEITPKSLANRRAERYSLLFAKPIGIIMLLLSPIVRVLSVVTNGLIRLLGGEQLKPEPYITEEELLSIVNVSQQEGVLEQQEKEMIHSIFEFGDTSTSDVMIPRIDVIAIPVDISYDQLLKLISQEQFSRIPVYEENIDNIIGILYIRDLLPLSNDQKADFHVRHLMRKPYYIPEAKKVDQLFREMQKKRIHMAIVVDEYGGTAGIVTLEDLIEEIMGDISDEFDEEVNSVQTIDEKVSIIDAGLHIEEANEMLSLNLPISEDWDTVGGLVLSKLGHIPVEGEKVLVQDVEISIQKMTKRRIEVVKIVKM